MKPVYISAAVVAVFTVSSASAQSTTDLDSVVVRENRFSTPAGQLNRDVQIITAAQIAQLPVKSTAELLSYVAGADLRQREPWGGQADISIDGSTSDAVLVLINGVKMSDPQTGHHIMNLPIPLSAIDHIEVLHGSAARVYGLNALAGAINIVTRLPKANEAGVQAYGGSSFQTDTSDGRRYGGWGAQAYAGVASKTTAHLLSAAYDRSNGYRYNSDLRSLRLFYQSRTRLSQKVSLEAMGGYVTSDFGASLFYAAPFDNEAVEGVNTATGAVSLPIQLNEKLRIMPRVSYRYNSDDYIYLRNKPDFYHNIHETGVATGELQSSLQIGRGALGLGLELRQEHIKSTNLGEHDRSNAGVYAEYRYAFSQRLTASAGLYFNHNSDWGSQLFPSADVGYRISRHLRLFAAASTGSRLPTYTDLYYRGPGNIGNPSLRPEEALYTNAGAAFSHGVLTGQVSAFYRHTTGFIDFVRPLDTGVKYFQPMNFQDVAARGASIRGDYNIAQALEWTKDYALTAGASYTWIGLDIQQPYEATTKYSMQALRHQLLVHAIGRVRKVSLSVQGRYLERMSYNDYFVLDARVTYALKRVDIYADGSNLLDQQYVEAGAVPMTGRWLTLGVRWRVLDE